MSKKRNLKIFLGSLPPKCTEASIAKLLSKHGAIKKVHLILDKTKSFCKGYGHVIVKNKATFDKILSSHIQIGGRNIFKEPFFQGKDLDNKKKRFLAKRIFISNIPDKMTSQQIADLFSRFGAIQIAYRIVSSGGDQKSFGFVLFEKNEDAQRCHKAKRVKFGKVFIYCRFFTKAKDEKFLKDGGRAGGYKRSANRRQEEVYERVPPGRGRGDENYEPYGKAERLGKRVAAGGGEVPGRGGYVRKGKTSPEGPCMKNEAVGRKKTQLSPTSTSFVFKSDGEVQNPVILMEKEHVETDNSRNARSSLESGDNTSQSGREELSPSDTKNNKNGGKNNKNENQLTQNAKKRTRTAKHVNGHTNNPNLLRNNTKEAYVCDIEFKASSAEKEKKWVSRKVLARIASNHSDTNLAQTRSTRPNKSVGLLETMESYQSSQEFVDFFKFIKGYESLLNSSGRGRRGARALLSPFQGLPDHYYYYQAQQVTGVQKPSDGQFLPPRCSLLTRGERGIDNNTHLGRAESGSGLRFEKEWSCF